MAKKKTKTNRKGKILFINAKEFFNQIDRAHREFTPKHIDRISKIVKSFRGESGSKPYCDELGICKVETFETIEKEKWSLSPERYVGIINKQKEHNFLGQLDELNEKLTSLNVMSHKLESIISEDITKLLY